MTPARYLRVQFVKRLRKGYVKNAELDPTPDESVRNCAEVGEEFIVKIVAKSGLSYWLTDRRVLLQREHSATTLFGYQDVCKAHWITKDSLKRAFATPDPERTLDQMKSDHFDRIEVELAEQKRTAVIEGLDQSYSPVLSFLWYLNRHRSQP